MAGGGNMALSVLLRARDNLTAPVTKARKLVRRFGDTVDRVGRKAGFDRLAASLRRTTTAAGNLLRTAGRIGRRFGLAAAGATAAITGITTSVAREGDEIAKFADQLGIGIEALQEWRFAGERMGVEQGTFNQSIGAFSKRLGEARQGVGRLYSQLKDQNPELLEQITNTHDLEEAFRLYLAAIGDAPDQIDKAALASAGFSRAGLAMIRITRDGMGEIDRLRKRAQELGLVLGEEAARDAEAFQDSLTNMRGAMSGIKNVIGGALLPAFSSLMDQITTFVVANRAEVKAWAENFAAELPGRIDRAKAALRGLVDDAVRLADRAQPLLDFSRGVIDRFGAMQTAAVVLGAVIAGPILAPLLSLTASMVSLTATVGGVAVKLASLAGVGTLLKAGFVAIGAGIKIAGAALLANPIVATIAAIAAAAGLIYAHWDRIGPWMADLWSGVTDTVSSAWDSLTDWLGWDPMAAIAPAWDSVTGYFGDLFGALKRLFSGDMSALEDLFKLSPLALIAGGFREALNWLSDIDWRGAAASGWEAAKGVFAWSPLGLISRGFGAARDWLVGVDWRGAAGSAWETAKDIFAWSPLGLISRGFGAARDWLAGVDWHGAAASAWETAKGIFAWSPLGTIARGFGAARDWLAGVDWHGAAASAWETAKDIFAWSPLGLISRGFGAARDWLVGVDWRGAAGSAWETAKGIFAWSPLGLIREGFREASDWLGNLDWAEHGRRLLTTLTAGIKSLAAKPAEAIQAALSGVRDLLPFSDARKGPLSQLTRSGRALPRTLAEGVTREQPVFVTSVVKATDAANDAITGAWRGYNRTLANQQAAVIGRPVAVHETNRETIREGSDTHRVEHHSDREVIRDRERDIERHYDHTEREVTDGDRVPDVNVDVPGPARDASRLGRAPERRERAQPVREVFMPAAAAGGRQVTIQRLDFRPHISIETRSDASPADIAGELDERLASWRDVDMWSQVQDVMGDQ
ncbi:MAG: hypothetical protein RLO11_09720 [Salinisphaeraceae bacterium]